MMRKHLFLQSGDYGGGYREGQMQEDDDEFFQTND